MGVNERKLKKKGEIDAGNKRIEGLLEQFKSEAQARLIEWRKEEAERTLKAEEAQVREDWRLVSFSVNALWTGIKFLMDVGEVTTNPGLCRR